MLEDSAASADAMSERVRSEGRRVESMRKSCLSLTARETAAHAVP